VRTQRNRGGGLTLAPAGLGAAEGRSISVTVEDFTSHDDGGNRTGGGIRLALPGPPFQLAHKVSGDVRVMRARIVNPSAWGVAVSRWVANAPRAVFEDVIVQNPNAAGSGAADFGWSAGENAIAANEGFVVALLAADAGAGAQRVEFRRCRVEDRSRSLGERHGFFVHSSNPESKTDVVFEP